MNHSADSINKSRSMNTSYLDIGKHQKKHFYDEQTISLDTLGMILAIWAKYKPEPLDLSKFESSDKIFTAKVGVEDDETKKRNIAELTKKELHKLIEKSELYPKFDIKNIKKRNAIERMKSVLKTGGVHENEAVLSEFKPKISEGNGCCFVCKNQFIRTIERNRKSTAASVLVNKFGRDYLKDGVLYMSPFPKPLEIKLLAQAGIKTIIYYGRETQFDPERSRVKDISLMYGIEIHKFPIEKMLFFKEIEEHLRTHYYEKLKEKKTYSDSLNFWYMTIAHFARLKSKDKEENEETIKSFRKVGAVIRKDYIHNDFFFSDVVGLGYNGMKKGVNNKYYNWDKNIIKDENNKDTNVNKILIPGEYKLLDKNSGILHAEQNAIILKNRRDLNQCFIYSTLHPCPGECQLLILDSNIKGAYFSNCSPAYNSDDSKFSNSFSKKIDIKYLEYFKKQEDQDSSVVLENDKEENDNEKQETKEEEEKEKPENQVTKERMEKFNSIIRFFKIQRNLLKFDNIGSIERNEQYQELERMVKLYLKEDFLKDKELDQTISLDGDFVVEKKKNSEDFMSDN